jgi:hypothetical protein
VPRKLRRSCANQDEEVYNGQLHLDANFCSRLLKYGLNVRNKMPRKLKTAVYLCALRERVNATNECRLKEGQAVGLPLEDQEATVKMTAEAAPR